MRFLALVLLLPLLISASDRQDYNSFYTETVISDLEVPWDIAFSKDGSLFFTERTGFVSLYNQGELRQLATPDSFTQLRVEGEAGLMGLALDPEFPEENYLYLCYSTTKNETKLNRVSRFLLEAKLEQEQTLITVPGSPGHNGCRLSFGPDNKLYISTGDAYQEEKVQDIEHFNGKILRLNKDGSIPEDNPFGNPVWSLGHRNPQGLAFHPATGKLYATEHGPDTNDELNLIRKGANYGWPDVVGKQETATFMAALESYHETSTIAIAGMTFYEGDAFDWQNNLLFVSLKKGQLYRVKLDEDGTVLRHEILLERGVNSPYGRLRDVAVSPEGFIYLATSNRNDRNNNPHPEDDRIIVLKPKTD